MKAIKSGTKTEADYKGTVFESHEKFDQFYLDTFGSGKPSDTEVYEYLRAIDRAFWIINPHSLSCPLIDNKLFELEVTSKPNPLNVFRGVDDHIN